MGYEYHDRGRLPDGTFAPRQHGRQIHVYCTEAQWRAIRLAAVNTGEELSAFCRNAAYERAKPIITRLGITENG